MNTPYRIKGTMVSDSPETVGRTKLIVQGENFVCFAEPAYADALIAALNATEEVTGRTTEVGIQRLIAAHEQLGVRALEVFGYLYKQQGPPPEQGSDAWNELLSAPVGPDQARMFPLWLTLAELQKVSFAYVVNPHIIYEYAEDYEGSSYILLPMHYLWSLPEVLDHV